MKEMKEKLRQQAMKRIVKKSMQEAELSINSACVWWLNQPQPPKALKKYRKF